MRVGLNEGKASPKELKRARQEPLSYVRNASLIIRGILPVVANQFPVDAVA
jgi:hypothetical protein